MNEESQMMLRRYLNKELCDGQRRNSAFSLRALARRFTISSAALSEIMQGKRNVSQKMMTRILEKSHNPTIEKETVRTNFAHSKSPREKVSRQRVQLGSDQFRIISEWHHYAILSLLQTIDCKGSSDWIAKRLAITEKKTKDAIKRLLRLGLVRSSGEKLVVTNKSVDSPDEVNSSELKDLHKQIMEIGIDRLYKTDTRDRDYTMMTLAVNKEKLPLAKEKIRQFLREMESLLETGAKQEVYSIAVQLVPLTIMGDEQ